MRPEVDPFFLRLSFVQLKQFQTNVVSVRLDSTRAILVGVFATDAGHDGRCHESHCARVTRLDCAGLQGQYKMARPSWH